MSAEGRPEAPPVFWNLWSKTGGTAHCRGDLISRTCYVCSNFHSGPLRNDLQWVIYTSSRVRGQRVGWNFEKGQENCWDCGVLYTKRGQRGRERTREEHLLEEQIWADPRRTGSGEGSPDYSQVGRLWGKGSPHGCGACVPWRGLLITCLRRCLGDGFLFHGRITYNKKVHRLFSVSSVFCK